MEQSQEKAKKPGFIEWLQEDDSPQIGIATKEPLLDYFSGVRSEFNKIEWPSREQVKHEFTTVIVIVTIISTLIYLIDIGLDRLVTLLK
jgi:preprotein translocase SecE subunit